MLNLMPINKIRNLYNQLMKTTTKDELGNGKENKIKSYK